MPLLSSETDRFGRLATCCLRLKLSYHMGVPSELRASNYAVSMRVLDASYLDCNHLLQFQHVLKSV